MKTLMSDRLKEELENVNNPFKRVREETEHIVLNKFNLLYLFLKENNLSIEDIAFQKNISKTHSGFVVVNLADRTPGSGWDEEDQMKIGDKSIATPEYVLMKDGKIIHGYFNNNDDIDKSTYFKFSEGNKSLTYHFFNTMGVYNTKPQVIRKVDYHLDFFNDARPNEKDKLLFEWYQYKEGYNPKITATLTKAQRDGWRNLKPFEVTFNLSKAQLEKIFSIEKEGIISNIGELVKLVGDSEYKVDSYSNIDTFRESCRFDSQYKFENNIGKLIEVMNNRKYLLIQ